jgi:hypothetical protein
MKSKHCFYTSFNKAYAGQALLLAASLRKAYGNEAHIVALVIDQVEGSELEYLDGFDEILLAEELEIPNFRSWIFGHTIVEAATAVKPFALRHLLGRFSQVTYLDPDIYVYSRLDEVTAKASQWDCALTPHQISPQAEEWVAQATELESLRYGVYNLGFLSVRASAEGKRVANWWAERCYLHCTANTERGLFTDQKLFDLAPALFSGVRVLRHPGYNVATWNVRERTVTLDERGLLVNGEPLRFCHFTKATHIGASALERMVDGKNLFTELFHAYIALLRQKNHELAGLDRRWTYGSYENGVEIADETRQAFRACKDRRWKLKDPFATESAVQSLIERVAAD